MSTGIIGTRGEDRSDYTREESRAIRRRSLRLLGSPRAPSQEYGQPAPMDEVSSPSP